MHLHRAAKSVGARFRKAEITDLPFFNQLSHGSNRFFNRSLGINAVLVVQVDSFDAEAPQAAFAGLADVVGFAAYTASTGVLGIADDPEFGSEDDFVAAAFDGASHKFFVFVRAIGIGGVEKENSEFKRAVNRGDGFGVVESGVELRHAHAAETLSGDFETGVAESADLHNDSLR